MKESKLPFLPNYLANPPFLFIYSPTADDSAQLQKGDLCTPPASPSMDGSPLLLPAPHCLPCQEPFHGTTALGTDNDFFDIELDGQERTCPELLTVSSCELKVNPDQVEKIRKLSHTLVRKDEDVVQLQDFQGLELVLMRSENNFLFRNVASTLTERSCYKKRASKLTY
ncbi:hypothetical protein HPG69_005775 [Diceros bicornis minor]|uniref:Uncharacterized protein n=1 Tax=Diceros bicornis minor TaxID=77932 RepID=A0A7J7ESP1_DICBM|nr:hypothetical protein HPG69_005775 [Diceros bicornis minor]